MKKVLLSLVSLFFVATSFAQVSENFSTVVNNQDISLSGWTNEASEGARVFIGKYYEPEANYYAQASAYNSTDASNVCWLVTPGVFANSSSVLSFKTKYGYYNADVASVWVSTDFTGDITTANWTEITGYTEPEQVSGGYSAWAESGSISLSSYAGQTVHVAFKYSGAAPSATTTWQVDDVTITGGSSINLLGSKSFSIYPNPVTSTLFVISENASKIVISNTIGQEVVHIENAKANEQISVADLQAGMYFVSVTDQNGNVSVKKLIKK